MSRERTVKSINGYDTYTMALARLADWGAVLFGGWLAYLFRFKAWHIEVERYSWAVLVFLLLVAIIFPVMKVYQSWRGKFRHRLILQIGMAYALVGLSLTFILYFFDLSELYSRIWIALFIAISFFSSVMIRGMAYPLINRLRLSGRNRREVLIIGDTQSCYTAMMSVMNNPSCGFDVGRVILLEGEDEYPFAHFQSDIEYYHRGEPLEVTEREVWLCLPLERGSEVKAILEDLSLTSSNIRYMPDMRDFRLINHNISQISDLLMLDITCSPMSGASVVKKRLEDLMLSALFLVVLSPLMLLLALGVKLSSRGPVLYSQERVSWNGKPFRMLKFRTMAASCEGGGVLWGKASAKPVTSFGRFLRRTSLDELPQFINVLKGDMSIVGPRPERTVFVEQFRSEIPGYMQKHMMKAGITGWAQVNGWRGDTGLKKRIECDLWYIENWSMLLDLKIIFLTACKMFIDKNAC
ncbi:undecaprenyl-phosphate glucose phosphotransferase [Larsenimonas suaedae]|uniref:Undecaprenyl-phosphate glucose phosphotransferase n=1 Tax=Larsenimonas suaedae TaxID=1851019 RepID=A0ABU1GWJ3_9GAMM|nr:undecaprenyl-phosphate glucose phosphotransferase [Larsenimonas suaedae]MCM2972979.1 undecaprenyl-phosphate glucose phosphotransferase [Larsenimonas suaedae]MDR5896416.1 undecaprenyl-phosphate glucose phosphotransferase [Larsenimonas suaedae]